MKPTITRLSALTICLCGLLTASCSKEEQKGPELNSITVDFVNARATKTSSTACLDLMTGTAAVYLASTGELLTSLSWTDGANRLTFDNIPNENILIYAVGNSPFMWPAKVTDLPNGIISIDLTKGYIPQASQRNQLEAGTVKATVAMTSLYSRVTIKRGGLLGYDFTAVKAYTTDCPETITPFGSSTSGKTSSDKASEADLTLFNQGGSVTLYVPSTGSTKVIVEGTRVTGDGIDHQDTYIITVPAIGHDCEKTLEVSGADSEGTIVITIDDDTRVAEFTYEHPDSAPDVVKGENLVNEMTVYANNGEPYCCVDLTWKGVPELKGLATVRVGENGQKSGLGSDGSISVQSTGPSGSLPVYIESSYTGEEDLTVTFNAMDKAFSVLVKGTPKTPDTLQRSIALLVKIPMELNYDNTHSNIQFSLNGAVTTLKLDDAQTLKSNITENGLTYKICVFENIIQNYPEDDDQGIDFAANIVAEWDEYTVEDAKNYCVMIDPWSGSYGNNGASFKYMNDEIRYTLNCNVLNTSNDGCCIEFGEHGDGIPQRVVYGITFFPDDPEAYK